MLRHAAASVGLHTTLLAVGGCGFALVKGPPTTHQSQIYFNCTEGNAGPMVDLGWASLSLLLVMTPGNDSRSEPEPVTGIAKVIGLTSAVVSGSSAIVGFGKTRRCRDAKRLLAERLAQGSTVAPQAAGAQSNPAAANSVQAVTIRPAADTIRVGESVQLVAAAWASSGAAIRGASFVWSSSNDAIASVNRSGLVTGNAGGVVVVAARTGTVVGTASVIVTPR